MKFKHLLVAGLLATTAASPAVHASDIFAELENQQKGTVVSPERLAELELLESRTFPGLKSDYDQLKVDYGQLEIGKVAVGEELEETKKQLGTRLQEVSDLRDRETKLLEDIGTLTNEKKLVEQEIEKFNNQLLTHDLVEKAELQELQNKATEAEAKLLAAEEKLREAKESSDGKTLIDSVQLQALEDDLKKAQADLQAALDEKNAAETEASESIKAATKKIEELEEELNAKEKELSDVKEDLLQVNNEAGYLKQQVDLAEKTINKLEKDLAYHKGAAVSFQSRLNSVYGAMDQALKDSLAKKFKALAPEKIAEASRSFMFALMTDAEVVDKQDKNKTGKKSLEMMFSSVFDTLLSSNMTLFSNISFGGEVRAQEVDGVTQDDIFVANSTVLSALDITQIKGASVEAEDAKKSDSSDSSEPSQDDLDRLAAKKAEEDRLTAEEADRQAAALQAQKEEADRQAAALQAQKEEADRLAAEEEEDTSGDSKDQSTPSPSGDDLDDSEADESVIESSSPGLSSDIPAVLSTWGTPEFDYSAFAKAMEAATVNFVGLQSALEKKASGSFIIQCEYRKSVESSITSVKKFSDYAPLLSLCLENGVNPRPFISME